MSDLVLYEAEDSVATITLNCLETRNALTDPDMLDAIEASFRRAADDASLRAVVITGAGAVFSSGGSLKKIKRLSQEKPSNSPVDAVNRYRKGVQRIPKALMRIEVPVIAAVNGPAIGAGCDLACMCEIRIAAQSARFAESFVRLGIVSGVGGAWLLPKVVGLSKAYEMALTGDAVGADEALACGLVSRVVPDEALMETARDVAGRIARNPPFAVRMTKALMGKSHLASYESILDQVASIQVLASGSEEHREAMQALKKR